MQNFLTRILALVVGVVIGIGVVIGALTLLQDDEGTSANTQATRPNNEGRDMDTRYDVSGDGPSPFRILQYRRDSIS